ncbi:hypothetical protein QQ045_027349 [Rhodiola kirilowii]
MSAMASRRAVHHCYRHFLIFLVLFCLLSAVLAAPATRSLKSDILYSSIQDTAVVNNQMMTMRKRSTTESNLRKGRTDIVLTDYSDPGANTGHEPVTPPPQG